jgi:TPR repeat protein
LRVLNRFGSDFPDELQATAKLAHSGNPEAQFSLGFAYDTGNEGLKVNTDEAIRWYTLSAQQGHAPAQNNLGVLYATGHKGRIERNHRMALRWYKAAAENGNASGQFHAALLLISGQGANKPNPEYAHQLLKRAAKQGHMMARATLGTAMFEGKICPKDEKKGLKMLQRAATSEDPVALHNLALIYKLGLGVTVDVERSSAYFGLAKQSKTSRLFAELAEENVGKNFIHY